MSARTYGTLRWHPARRLWSIDRLEPHATIRLKALFPSISIGRVAPFTFDDRPERAADLLWFMERYPLEMSEADRRRIVSRRKRYRDQQKALETCLSADYVPRSFSLKGELRPYQTQPVELLLRGRRLLVGDDVGLGKTVVAIGAMSEKETLPALVVVPTHLPLQWKEQIEKFLDLDVHRIDGRRPYDLPNADVFIIRYSCISGWADYFQKRPMRMVVFDEAQELRREGSQRYMAAQAISAAAEYVLGLSATPVYNYGDEIFNVIDVLKEGALGTRDEFIREWTTHDKRTVKDTKALGAFLRDSYLFIRRTRKDVGRELPTRDPIVHTVGYDEAEMQKMEDVAKTLALTVLQGKFVERGQAARELDMLARQATGISKAKYVAEYVRILLENKEPVLLAGWHREVYDIWLRELAEFRPVLYTGSESATQKERSRQAFLRGDTDLMIMSLRSGTGMDGLQERCSVAVFGELDWSPLIHRQVIGRLARDGQREAPTAIYLVSDAGSDPLIVNLHGIKGSQATGITDPDQGPIILQPDDSRIRMLAERFLEKRRAA